MVDAGPEPTYEEANESTPWGMTAVRARVCVCEGGGRWYINIRGFWSKFSHYFFAKDGLYGHTVQN